jgi:hypothetical protein
MEFIFQYPIWFIGFCLLLGFVYAFVLYYKSDDFSDDSIQFNYIKKGLSFVRFLTVSILAFLLLSPLVKTRFIDKIKPSIVIAHDNSSSINLGFKKLDSARYINSLNKLHNAFSDKYQLDFYRFSDKLTTKDTLDFKDKKTNISNVLTELNGNYYNRNVGAVVLATDGIYNEGQNPVYTDFSFPIYAIALGDTSIQRDLKITKVNANKIAYLGDNLQVIVNIESYNLNNESYKISIFKHFKGQKNLVQSKNLQIKNDYTEQESTFELKINNIGIQRYSVEVSKLAEEVTYNNNSSNFYIDVIDSRQKILILANAPHPDLAVLKQSISLNKNFDLKIEYANQRTSNLNDYNLVILHQLPSTKHPSNNVFAKIKKDKIPYWLITGSATDYQLLNTIQTNVSVEPSAENRNDATAFYNKNFNTFTLDPNTSIKLKRFPPLVVPFGSFNPGAGSTALLFQQIGMVETEYPILSFSENFDVKSAIFIGDGLWRWKLHDFVENKNHDAFNEIFIKTINYLALKSDKRKFRVATAKNLFYEGESVVIEAELYNQNYELINTPEVALMLKNEKNESFPLVFNRTSNAYSIKTTNLPIGNYNYLARTTFNNKKFTAEGAFSIKSLQIEALQTKANHKILYQLAEKTGGKVFYPNQLDQLKELLLNRKDIKPTLYESFKTRSIINLQWLFYLLLILLSIEWFTRKYFGGY